MAVSYVNGATGSANPTTSFTVVIPTVAVDDQLILEFTHRGTGTGSVSDNDTGGNTWTRKGEVLYAASAFSLQSYYKYATSATSGKTITVTGLTNSSAAVLTVYRGGPTSGDPYESWVGESNVSGNVQHDADADPATKDGMTCLVVANSPDVTVATQSISGVATTTERVEHLSTGGTDTSISHASGVRTFDTGVAADATWTQSAAGASASLLYSIPPAAGPPAVVMPNLVTARTRT